jgi:hypothetical protein
MVLAIMATPAAKTKRKTEGEARFIFLSLHMSSHLDRAQHGAGRC